MNASPRSRTEIEQNQPRLVAIHRLSFGPSFKHVFKVSKRSNQSEGEGSQLGDDLGARQKDSPSLPSSRSVNSEFSLDGFAHPQDLLHVGRGLITPPRHVDSQNLHRRHLTLGERLGGDEVFIPAPCCSSYPNNDGRFPLDLCPCDEKDATAASEDRVEEVRIREGRIQERGGDGSVVHALQVWLEDGGEGGTIDRGRVLAADTHVAQQSEVEI